MNVFFRIIDVFPEENTFTVRYWSDKVSENTLSTSIDVRGDIMLTSNGYPIHCSTDTNLTIYDTANTSSNDILNLIQSATPFWAITPKVNTVVNFTNVNTFLYNVNSYSANDANNLILKTQLDEINDVANKCMPNVVNNVINYMISNKMVVANT